MLVQRPKNILGFGTTFNRFQTTNCRNMHIFSILYVAQAQEKKLRCRMEPTPCSTTINCLFHHISRLNRNFFQARRFESRIVNLIIFEEAPIQTKSRSSSVKNIFCSFILKQVSSSAGRWYILIHILRYRLVSLITKAGLTRLLVFFCDVLSYICNTREITCF